MTDEKTSEEAEYEDRLRRRLKVLKEQMKEGKVRFAKDLGIEDSLLAVREGPDGEIDLNTVDARVRSLALAVTAMHDREKLKEQASLSEIQTLYFKFLGDNFGSFYDVMLERKLTPHDVGIALTQDPEPLKELNENLEKFLDVIVQFWNEIGDIALYHVQDIHRNVTGVFGGDLFPSNDENIASKCGIYTDTIVLPDPFLRSQHIFENYPEDRRAYYLVKHAMNVLQYRDLACADLEVPIVVVLPDAGALQEEERDFIFSLGKKDSLIHAAKLFGRGFESFEELMEFAEELDSIEKTVAEIGDESRVLFDTEWTGDVSSQLKQALDNEHYRPFVSSPGMLLASQAAGRMSVSNELLIKARRLNGTPIIDAPTSWQYLAWKMEYDSERAESQLGEQNLHVVRGLQDLSKNDMQWLGNVPPDALIEIRKQGALGEIREMLGSGINEIIDSNPTNFHRSRDRIFDNINDAFDQHKRNIEELRAKKWRFAGEDLGTWMVTGSLAVTAAITGMPVWGLAAIASDQLLDAPKLKDIPQSIRELAEESNNVKKSPVGMLFSVSKEST